jgi:hypothetical protein
MLTAILLMMSPAMQEPPVDAADPPKKPAREKLICKSETKTGSRVNFREICHTAAEWDMIHRENRNAIDKAQRERGWYQK